MIMNPTTVSKISYFSLEILGELPFRQELLINFYNFFHFWFILLFLDIILLQSWYVSFLVFHFLSVFFHLFF